MERRDEGRKAGTDIVLCLFDYSRHRSDRVGKVRAVLKATEEEMG